MKKQLLLVVVALVFIGACTHRVDIVLRPDFKAMLQKGNELTKVTPALQFFKGDYTDKRTDPKLLTTFQQGPDRYNLFGERPMADAIYEGLRAALTASGQTWNEGNEGEVKLNVTFVNLSAARSLRFFKVGAESTIQVMVDFVNGKTGDTIFTNIYSGTDKRHQALIGLMGMITDSIDASIVRCIQSVVDDAELVKALGKLQR